ncbi:hypothetical protein JAAARDRAFT_63100 [Jaapia argillacea MUCL 33604]|uniref:F-box domain-containing protein n=1 Tax=Jaapia argillacea MUCL 33604 TaxID=933084 RepID=A0A067P9K3_9AGAM|nr:hypothetical protein JAAARDRAFT_63100 [Jaapia argillacea MUCL 33604]
MVPGPPSLARLPYEIRLEVFRNLQDDTRRWRHIIANIASSCRALSDPAIDVLWHTMDDLQPLLALIPGVQIDRDPDEPFTYFDIIEPIQPSAWQRFDTYAKRVRVLEYKRPGNVFFNLFADLGRYRPGPLLPNLRQLSWDDEASCPIGSELGHILLSFPTSSLREVTIAARYIREDEHDLHAVQETDLAQAEFLPRLASGAPMLRCLALSGYMPNLLLGALPQFSSLTDLTLSDLGGVLIDLSTFRALSCLSALSAFSVNLKGVPIEGFSGWTGFPCLQFFTVDDASIPIATAAISTISSVQINEIWVNDTPPASIEELRRFFATLRNFRHTLSTVSVTVDALTSPNGCIYTLTAIIESLLEAHRMVLLQIISGLANAVLVTDECMDKMAVAWPRIKILTLYRRSSLPGPTVRGLAILAQKCPSLSNLRLDTIDFRNPIDVGAVPLLEGRLESLSFRPWTAHGDNNVMECFKIAQIIDRLYPNVGRFPPAPNLIVQFIFGLRAARCDERRRMRADTVRMVQVVSEG